MLFLYSNILFNFHKYSTMKENQLEVLKQTELLGRQFTVYGTPDVPLFKAADVAAIIEHTDPSKMAQSVDEDESCSEHCS